MTNRDKFKAKLTKLFDGVRESFQANEIVAFRKWADRQESILKSQYANETPPGRGASYRDYEPGKLVKFIFAPDLFEGDWHSGYNLLCKIGQNGLDDPATREKYKLDHPARALAANGANHFFNHPDKWKGRKAIVDAGFFVADYDMAEREARAYVRDCEAAFVAKQSQKLASAVGDREVTALEGTLSLDRGVVTGTLTVTCGADKFVAIMEIKTNYRYGMNAANRNLTVYAQYPTRFKNVTLNGETFKSKSEKWLAEHFSPVKVA